MKNIVRQVIHEWNPFGLLPHAPIDEFDSEIEKVALGMRNVLIRLTRYGNLQRGK